MTLQLPTYPNITATIGRPTDGLFYEVTLILHITPERGHILYSEAAWLPGGVESADWLAPSESLEPVEALDGD